MLAIILMSSIVLAEESTSHIIKNGVLMGYVHIHKDKELFIHPHAYTIGFENIHIASASGPIQILVKSNISILGINQGLFLPTGSCILGYQIRHGLYVGVGPRAILSEISPDNTKIRTNIILSMGYDFDMNGIYIPIQLGYVPDIYGRDQVLLSVGFNKILHRR